MELLNKTVGEVLKEQAIRYPENEAYVYPERDLRRTYAEFDEETDRLAKAFMGIGIQKGEHVAIWSDKKPQWLLSQFATGKMGAVLVTVNTNYQAAELQYLLQQSEATTLILDEGFKNTSYLEILRSICPSQRECDGAHIYCPTLPNLKRVILMTEKNECGIYNWSEFLRHEEMVLDEEFEQRRNSLHPDDVINIQYTSGTTGFPKGVMLTHNNVVNNGNMIAETMKLSNEDRLCIPVPFFHCFGCVLGTLAAVTHGATMVIVEQFEPARVLHAVQDEKCTALHGVPTMFIAELNHPDFGEYDTSTLRTGIMVGSTCPIEVMGAAEITICYGLTEASPVISQTKTDDPIEKRVTTVGKPHPHVEVKITEPVTNEELPIGESGELCTRLVAYGRYC